jgi:hypothetical protein
VARAAVDLAVRHNRSRTGQPWTDSDATEGGVEDMPTRRVTAPATPTPAPRSFPGAGFARLPSDRSPLVALTGLLGIGLLATGMAAGRPALAAAVLLVQLLLGLCWLVVLQASLSTAALVGLTALGCDSLLLRKEADAGSVAGILGLAMLAAIIAQLLRRQRREVTAALAATMSGAVLVAAVSLLLPLRQFSSGEQVGLTALVAIAVAVVVARVVPGPAVLVRSVGLLAATAVGARYGATTGNLSAAAALGIAAAAAVFALIVDLGVVRMSAEIGVRQRPALRPVAALLPVAAAVPAVYVLGWVIGG